MASFWSDTLVDWINQATGVDDSAGVVALAVESVQERAIEQEKGFICTTTIPVSADDYEYFTVVTPSDKVVTLFNFFATTDSVVLSKFELFEDGTIDTGGSATNIWLVNTKRTSTVTADTACLVGATLTAEGTKIMEINTGLSGYVVTGNPSIQLKEDTTYVFKLHNASTTTAISYNLYFQLFELPV